MTERADFEELRIARALLLKHEALVAKLVRQEFTRARGDMTVVLLEYPPHACVSFAGSRLEVLGLPPVVDSIPKDFRARVLARRAKHGIWVLIRTLKRMDSYEVGLIALKRGEISLNSSGGDA
jgi:hypothetical protein